MCGFRMQPGNATQSLRIYTTIIHTCRYRNKNYICIVYISIFKMLLAKTSHTNLTKKKVFILATFLCGFVLPKPRKFKIIILIHLQNLWLAKNGRKINTFNIEKKKQKTNRKIIEK